MNFKEKITLLSALIIVIASFTTTVCTASEPRHSVKLNTSYMIELYPEKYYYRACDLSAEYGYSFLQTRWCSLEAVGAIHYATTRYATQYPPTNYARGYEMGFTAGMNWNIKIVGDYFSANIMGFIGPLYTPSLPARQGGKLNFSDNLAAGFSVKLCKYLYADVRGGFRHMSNAGLSSPNHGINTPWFGFGFLSKF